MAKELEKSAKTVEDALRAALEELGVDQEDVTYEVIEEPTKGIFGFGSKPAKIRVSLKSSEKLEQKESPNFMNDSELNKKEAINDKIETNIKTDEVVPVDIDETKVELATKFLQEIFKTMKLQVTIESSVNEDGCLLQLTGENLGVLIGKHGQTLDALQYIVNIVSNRNENKRTRFIIDVENYRGRRAEILQNLATNLAERAIRMHQDIRLEPMNRYERKVIHSALQDNSQVVTHSAGDEPHRYVIISPTKYGKSKIRSKNS